MELQGRVKKVGEVQSYGASGFTKRDLVITTDENSDYPQDILIEFHKDNTQKLSNYKGGELVDVKINLRGREWISPQGDVKYFNTLVGWYITTLDASESTKCETEPTSTHDIEVDDDLPF